MKKSKSLVFLLTSLFVVGCGSASNSSTPSTSNPVSSSILEPSNPSSPSTPVEPSSPSTPSTPSSPSSPSTPVEPSSPSTPEETKYTVTFKDGDKIIYQAEGKTGDFVDIPDDLESDDSRYTFQGWEGLDEADKEAGKVEIFSEDLVFQAKWYERFGTEKEFSVTKVYSGHNIVADGVRDAAYDDAVEIPVETVTAGSTDTTAKVSFMWDDTYFYVFADVKDSTVIGRDYSYNGGQWTEHNDTFEIWIDLLHEDSKASATWDGGWGGGYRGEPGPMCEAHFKINAGYNPQEGSRFGAGSEACWDGWWSNECNNDGDSVGISKITETGYTVEYKIKATHGAIPEDLRLKAGEQIGVGVKIYDKTTEDAEGDSKENPAPNAVAMEAINGDMRGPKKLSNVNVVNNANESKTVLNVKEVRDCFTVEVDDSEDLLYRDAATYTFGNSTAKMLWDAKNIYVYADLAEETEYIKFSSPLLENDITVTSDVKEFAISTSNTFIEGATAELNVTYKEAEEVTTEYLLKFAANDNNHASARHMFEAKKLAADAEITVDGTKDAAYNDTQEIDISTIALTENGKTAEDITTRGKGYIRWDDTYLYVFVDVTDDSVNAVTVGDPWNNDSVEFWLSTCQSLPTANTGWGDANRPAGNTAWCGEGGWRVWAGNIGGLSGSHWMYDWADGCPREVASVVTETGYTVEYKLHLSAFAGVQDKENQVIDCMININDGANGVRNGIVSTNTGGQNAWDKPYNLDHLRLVA